ncbi:DUF190 domain-containing protein [Streptomyces sp. RFCAC02]|uniref:DUF190 domain-containing protein n=1 Tax=Streptomyces sp. RFCAC02 TaxID=2499143 RepID=UPI001F1023F5|nr:DUF190 domain-containing protein [Streptomyces sp. RFCAC02]
MTTPPPAGAALRLTVLLGQDDTAHHHPLHTEVVRRAHAAGLAGASVFQGVEGYGRTSVVHTARMLSMSEALPVMVVLVDTADRIRAFIPDLTGLLDGRGLATVEPVEVVR